MAKTFLLSDESINCYGIRILSSGLDVAAFQKNPLMLFMHERGKVIGRWVNLREENNTWLGDAEFDVADTYANTIAGKVDRDFLKACSVSVQIGELVWNDALACYDAVTSCLKEISIVDFGGNTNAVQLCDQHGQPLTALELAAVLNPVTPISPPTTPPMALQLAALALAMGLTDTATEEDVMRLAGKVKTATTAETELATLKDSIKADKAKVALSLVDTAIADKRITATQKDTYLKLFAVDHDATAAIVAGLPVPQNLITLAATGATASVNESDEATKLYDQYDRADKLVKLKGENPTEFNRLYRAKHGVDFKA